MLVQPGDRLLFDSGTTVLDTARALGNDLVGLGALTAITCSLPIAQELGPHRGIHMLLLGGIYLPEHRLVTGPQTIESLRSLHADKMFLGTDGMTLSHGVTTANVLEAEVDRAMIKAADEVILVVDSSKIGGIGLTTILPLERVHKLITCQDVPADFVKRAACCGGRSDPGLTGGCMCCQTPHLRRSNLSHNLAVSPAYADRAAAADAEKHARLLAALRSCNAPRAEAALKDHFIAAGRHDAARDA